MSRIPEWSKRRLPTRNNGFTIPSSALRGGIGAPFRIWLYGPELADRTPSLGGYVRLKSVLEPRISELAILITARFRNCQTEWSIHGGFAEKAGPDREVIEAIRNRQTRARIPAYRREGRLRVLSRSG